MINRQSKTDVNFQMPDLLYKKMPRLIANNSKKYPPKVLGSPPCKPSKGAVTLSPAGSCVNPYAQIKKQVINKKTINFFTCLLS